MIGVSSSVPDVPQPMTSHPDLEPYADLIRYYLDVGRTRIIIPVRAPVTAPAVRTVLVVQDATDGRRYWRVATDSTGRSVAGQATESAEECRRQQEEPQ